MLPFTVYTNLFTLPGTEPAANQYVKCFMVWLAFVQKFGGLGEGDRIVAAIDMDTFTYIKTVPRYVHLMNSAISLVELYDRPQQLIDGMAIRYSMADALQQNEPGRLYMYLDVDVLVVRPLRELFVGVIENKVHIATEEYLKGLVGDIFHCYYLDGRVEMTAEERARVSRFGGISSGMFAWHQAEAGWEFFRRILAGIGADKAAGRPFIHTIDQPYFNERVVRTFLENEGAVAVMPSTAFGFNTAVGADPRYVLLNYAGNVGDGEFHFKKMEEYYRMLFN